MSPRRVSLVLLAGILFGIASSTYLLALVALYLLAPGLKKVEFTT